MANLTISEYGQLANTLPQRTPRVSGLMPAPPVPALAEQTVAIGATSVQSAAMGDGTTYVRVHAGAACCLAFGADPTATDEHELAAGETGFYGIRPGAKIAVIAV